MSQPTNPLSDAEDRFIETLLDEAYAPDQTSDRSRIDRLMGTIRHEPNESETPVFRASSAGRSAGLRWKRLAIAACVLIACGYAVMLHSSSNSAYAAVMRAIQTSLPTRQYRVQMTNRWPVVGQRDVTAKLYVNDNDEFCVWHPGWLPGGEIWVGGDLDSRWIVPPVGPVLTGDENLIASALQSEGLGTPLLHLQTLLTRMAQDYDLELLDDNFIADPRNPSEQIRCRHVAGIRTGDDVMMPTRIDLWANDQSGVAERVELQWPEGDDSWLPLRWQIELVDFPELADDWFKFHGHCVPGRLVLPIGTDTPDAKSESDEA
ncbi:hypothetical protein [Neorhodopirellula lusitana]|uniref:hypothetical protein n=1 Tax=Neorhodopirellula lusitana TaxID=445327 RepID=UPI003851685D